MTRVMEDKGRLASEGVSPNPASIKSLTKSAILIVLLIRIPKMFSDLWITLNPFISLSFNFFEGLSLFCIVTQTAVE